MSPRVALVLCGWAAACGAGSTPRDGGGNPVDGGVDGAPSDAGSLYDASLDAQVDPNVDAGRCLVEVCECGQFPSLCPAEARFCCISELAYDGPDQCFPTDPQEDGLGPYHCVESPLESAQPSDCRTEDVNDDVPGNWIDDPERCPDERPNCCGRPETSVVCADHDLTGWNCSIGIWANCADRFGNPDSSLCPADHPLCCTAHGEETCSARFPPPDDWECDLD